jgi:hypothetical protein
MVAETPRARIAADRITMSCGLLSSLRLAGVAASFAAALLTGVAGAQTSDSAKRADVPASYGKAFAAFNEKKPEIYALYSDSIGKLMDRGTVKETLRYFDEFYDTINNQRAAKRSIIESCIGRN